MISKTEIWQTRYVFFSWNLWIVVNDRCLKKLIFFLLNIFLIDFHNCVFHRDALKGSSIWDQPDIVFLRRFDYRWNLLLDVSTHSNGQIERQPEIRNFKYIKEKTKQIYIYIYIYIYMTVCLSFNSPARIIFRGDVICIRMPDNDTEHNSQLSLSHT